MDYYFVRRDDFEYATVDIPSHFNYMNGAPVINTTKGRSGSKALELNNTNQYVAFDTTTNPLFILSALITPPSNGDFIGTWQVFSITKNGNSGNLAFSLRLRNDLGLDILGWNGAFQDVAHTLLRGGTEHHIEVHVSLSIGGLIKIYINELLVYSSTGNFNISVGTETGPYVVGLGQISFNVASTPVYYDDLKVYNGLSLGIQIGDNDREFLLANANGAINDYVAVGGPDHWELVDVLEPDDAILEYEESSVPGDIGLYSFDIPSYLRLHKLRVLTASKEDGIDHEYATYHSTFRYGAGPTIINGPAHNALGVYTNYEDDIDPVPAVVGTTIEAGIELESFGP